MIIKKLDYFNPGQIADSGQCFRWKEEENGHYSLIAFGKKLEIWEKEEGFAFSTDENEWYSIWSAYFDLETDYASLGKKIDQFGDAHLRDSFEKGSGIRILRQDLWEMIVSFIISQNNNIPRIRGSIEKLCEKAGLPAEGGGYRFPGPGEVSREVFFDKSMGFGYRDQYLANIYEFAEKNPFFLDELRKMDYNNALGALLKIKGIGNKVANCICLFGLHHVEAFPIDTHVKQLMDKYYPEGLDLKPYEGAAGIIQQYLFYAEIRKDGNQ